MFFRVIVMHKERSFIGRVNYAWCCFALSDCQLGKIWACVSHWETLQSENWHFQDTEAGCCDKPVILSVVLRKLKIENKWKWIPTSGDDWWCQAGDIIHMKFTLGSPKKQIVSSFTHAYVIPNLFNFLSAKHKRRTLASIQQWPTLTSIMWTTEMFLKI